MSQVKGNRHVPVEVVEVIIDHLYNDKRTLTACSLVSREWLPTSRYHLLQAIRVDISNYRDLLQILNSPYSRFSLSVRELRIVSLVERDNTWINEAISALSKHFSSITTISLVGIKWRQLTPRTVTYLRTAFPEAKQIFLIDCCLLVFSNLVELLGSFKIAKFIAVISCKLDSTGQYPSPNLTISPLLRELVVNQAPHLFLTWLSDQYPLQLERLSVDAIAPTNFSATQTILSRAGSFLKIFQFRFSDNFMQLANQPHLDLSQNTSLQQLEVTLAFPNPFSIYVGLPISINISFLLPLFSSILSSDFRDVKLRILVASPDDLIVINWREIDKLSKERPWGSSVKRVMIELTDMVPENDPEGFMEEAELIIYPGLSDLAKRGLLNVRFVPLMSTTQYM